MDPVSLILGLIPLFGGLFGGGKDKATTTTATMDPAIKELLNSQQARMKMQDPLFEAVTRMAMGLMPTQYQGKVDTMGTFYGPGAGRYGTTGTAPGDNPRGTPGESYTGPFPAGSRKGDDNRNDPTWSSPDDLRERRRTKESRW